MFKITQSIDVYKKRDIKKFIYDDNNGFVDYNPVDQIVISKDFENREEAIEFAKEYYKKSEKISSDTNNIYLTNIFVLDYKDDENQDQIENFGISIYEIKEEYLKYKELEEDIDYFVSENDIQSVEELLERFNKNLDNDLVHYNEPRLIDFEDYLLKTIKKRI